MNFRHTKANKFQTNRPIRLKLPPERKDCISTRLISLDQRQFPNSVAWVPEALRFGSILAILASQLSAKPSAALREFKMGA